MAQPHPDGGGREACRDSDSGASLDVGGLVGDVPALPEQLVEDLVGGADLLQEQDVGLAFGDPRVHPLAVGGADFIFRGGAVDAENLVIIA